MSLNQVNSSGELERVAGLVNSEKINEMYKAFPSNASASNKLVTADETHDLQLFIDGATYTTTTDFINKLASEINAIKPNTSRTYGGTISGEWTGKTYFIGTYTVNNTGAGIAQIKCENAQSGKDVCVFTMSGGSPAVVSWQKLITESDIIVKKGTWEGNLTLYPMGDAQTRDRFNIPITFDSSMPDSNYTVVIEFFESRYVTIRTASKTASGFHIEGANADNNANSQLTKITWTAIRFPS